MNGRLLALYIILPLASAAFSVAVYLAPRVLPTRVAWAGAFADAAFLAWVSATVLHHASAGVVPLTMAFEAFGTLHGILLVGLTGLALLLRSRSRARWPGLLVLLIAMLPLYALAQYAAAHFLDFVNASA